MSTAHSTWAQHYDEAYRRSFGDFYDRLTEVTVDCIRRIQPPPARVIDFGAGTGRLAHPLAKAGYSVMAVDPCAEMLAVLDSKVEEAQLPIQTVCCRMQDRVEAAPFDLAVCVFTVLLYQLDEIALNASLQSAAAAVRPDGKLLLDIPSRQIFRSYTRTEPDFVREVQVTAETDVLFRYEETIEIWRDGRWSKHEDSFRIRHWEQSQVLEALDRAGFVVMEDLTSVFAGTGSQYLVARRRISE